MADIQKVIEAWKIFRNSNPYQICDGREFRAISEPEYCMGQMIADTIELLEEQQKKTAEHNGMTETVSRTIGQDKVFQLFTDMIAWVAKRTLHGYEFEQFIQEFFKEKD